MTKLHKYMNHDLSQEERGAKSKAIMAIVYALVVMISVLSSSPSHAASAERDFSKCVFGEQGTNNCQKQQSKAFNKCIEKASEDGELTQEEYNICAYSIYA